MFIPHRRFIVTLGENRLEQYEQLIVMFNAYWVFNECFPLFYDEIESLSIFTNYFKSELTMMSYKNQRIISSLFSTIPIFMNSLLNNTYPSRPISGKLTFVQIHRHLRTDNR